MTAGLAAVLVTLAALDGAFAGFRASRGRDGLVWHAAADRVAAARGAGLSALLVGPVGALVLVDAARPGRTAMYNKAAVAALTVYGPYAVLVLVALGAYLTLSWRRAFLASAVLLGPLTLVRPIVAVAGVVFAAVRTGDLHATVLMAAAAAAVLAVEPACGRRWYAQQN